MSELDYSSHERLWYSVRDSNMRIIRCYELGHLSCIVLVIENWKRVFNIYSNLILENSKPIQLLELKKILENI